MIDNIMNEYGYHESGVDNPLMNNVLNEDNTIGLGKNTTSKTEGSWPFDQTNHSNGSTPMGSLDIMSFYKKEPTPPEPTGDYMYFEAAEANSTVSLISTLATAPNLEYSTDGTTWQEWEYTDQSMEGMTLHNYDTLTLTDVGDRVYLRGDNPNGFATSDSDLSVFNLSGSIISGGKLVSLIDKTMNTVVLPDSAFRYLFMVNDSFGSPALLTPPSLEGVKEIGAGSLLGTFVGQGITSPSNMDDVETIKAGGCNGMYQDCTSLISASDLPSINLIGYDGCRSMYSGCTSLTAAANIKSTVTLSGYACSDMYKDCTFDMSSDGTALNFDFPAPPVTTIGDYTYSTAYDIAQWMGNTNGFNV